MEHTHQGPGRVQQKSNRAGPGGSTVALAGYMAKEYILLYLDQQEFGNNESEKSDFAKTDNNRWGPYMELLPWKRGINNQEHVLFWNEAKIEELLRGSLCYNEAKSLREEVALSISVLGPLLKRSVRMAKGDISKDPLERLTSLLQWQQTNVFPFPSLGIYPVPVASNYSLEDLRLIYHIASVYDELSVMDANNFTLWTRHIPM